MNIILSYTLNILFLIKIIHHNQPCNISILHLSSVKRLMTFIFCKTWGPTHQGIQTLTTHCNFTCSKLTKKIRWDLLNTALAPSGTFSKNLSQSVHIQIFSAVFGTEWARALVGVLSCQLFPCTVKKWREKKRTDQVRFRTNSQMQTYSQGDSVLLNTSNRNYSTFPAIFRTKFFYCTLKGTHCP